MHFRTSAATSTAACALAAGTLFAGAAHADPALRAALKQGETFRYVLERDTSIESMGQTVDVDSLFEWTFKVDSAGDEGADVNATIDRVSMDVNQGGMTFNFDSDDPDSAASPLAQVLNPLIGLNVGLNVAPEGDASMYDNAAIRNNPILSQMLTAEDLNMTLSRLFRIDGNPGAVKKGDSWTHTITESLDDFTRVVYNQTYTVDSVENDVVTLSVEGDASIDFDENMPEEQRPSLELHELTGAVVWDGRAGALRTYDYNAEFTISGVNPQMGQVMEARMKQSQSLRRLN